MVTYTYLDLQTVMDLSTDVTPTEIEALIDLAIDLLNLLGRLSLTNMAGAAGSKSVTLTSAQRGAVQLVARNIYFSFYKDPTTTSIGSLSVNPADVLANPAMLAFIQTAADRLATIDEDVPFQSYNEPFE